MNHDAVIIITLLVLNLIVSVAYLYTVLHRGKREKGAALTGFIFMIVFPVVGPLFKLSSWLLGKMFTATVEGKLSMKELSFDQTRMNLRLEDDLEEELDKVSIEDALLSSGRQSKRNAFIDVLKSDNYDDLMGSIQSAVEDNDMEISHYAATFISDSRAKFKELETEAREAFEGSEDMETAVEYTKLFENSFNVELCDVVELRYYGDFLEKVAIFIFERDPDSLNDRIIAVVVKIWQTLGEEKKLVPWISRAEARFRESLECFKICAEYYYRKNDREHLGAIIKEIKTYSLPLDSEAVEWIRFFDLN